VHSFDRLKANFVSIVLQSQEKYFKGFAFYFDINFWN